MFSIDSFKRASGTVHGAEVEQAFRGRRRRRAAAAGAAVLVSSAGAAEGEDARYL